CRRAPGDSKPPSRGINATNTSPEFSALSLRPEKPASSVDFDTILKVSPFTSWRGPSDGQENCVHFGRNLVGSCDPVVDRLSTGHLGPKSGCPGLSDSSFTLLPEKGRRRILESQAL